jgi:hypothetical protein
MTSAARYAGALAILALLVVATWWLLFAQEGEPPRKVHEITVVTIVPPPPPPPPTPPEQEKIVEETHQQFEENKPDEKAPEEPQKESDAKNDDPPTAVLPGAEQPGPGDYRGGSRGPSGGPGGGSKWAAYGEMVQSQIHAALDRNKKTRTAVARMEVRLWADAVGRVSRVLLGSSTGNAELDAAIRDEVLGQLTLREPPPQGMPMPIVARITLLKK